MVCAKLKKTPPTKNPSQTASQAKSSQFILIRGLARETRHWGDFPTTLAAAANASFECIDLPGAGRFSEMRSPASIPDITEFVREKFLELRRKLRDRGEKPAERTYLVAVSLGGMIASSWLDRWPGDFDGCILINTSFRGHSPFFKRLKPLALPHLLRVLTHPGDPLAQEKAVLELVSNRPEIRAATAEAWAKIQQSRPIGYENFARQLLAAARFTAGAKPPVPVLVLNSVQDRMVDASCSLEIASAWQAELRRHLTAGHDLTLDDGPWVTEQILDWRQRLEKKSD